jgi:hypothetical protein
MLIPLGFIGQGSGTSSAPGPWWYAIVSDTSGVTQVYSTDLATDNAGNAYFEYSGTGPTYQEPKIYKIDNTGAVTWVRRLYGSTWSQDMNHIQWANGAIYAAGVNGTGSVQNNYVQKLNADGTAAVNQSINMATATSQNYGITADTSGNTYTLGAYYTGSTYNNFITQIVPAGTLGWGLYWSGYDNFNAIMWGTNNLYMHRNGQNYKFNSSGTVINSRSYTTTPAIAYQGKKFGIDSSDNSYKAGGNGSSALIMKFDTDLLLTWGKTFTISAGFGGYTCGSSIDSSNNVYAWFVAPGQNKSMIVIKVNSAGTVLWQRSFAFRISGSYPYIYGGVAANYSNGDLIISLYQDTTTQRPQIIAKLPADGTKTGTYTSGSYSFDWTAESYTITTFTATYGSANTPITNTPTISTAAPSNAAYASYTLSKTDVP